MAKNVMAARLAAKCEVQFAYAIGHPDPVSVHVETFGTNAVPNEKIIRAINRVFDFQPASIIDHLKLRVRSTRRPPITDTSARTTRT